MHAIIIIILWYVIGANNLSHPHSYRDEIQQQLAGVHSTDCLFLFLGC